MPLATNDALQLAWSIPDFILGNLRRKREDNSFCFSYTPLDDNYVHNANMLGVVITGKTGSASISAKNCLNRPCRLWRTA
jgi:hypothetical protein